MFGNDSAPKDARELSLIRATFCLTLALFHLRDFTTYQDIVETWHPYFQWPYRAVPSLAHFYLDHSAELGILFIFCLISGGLGVLTRPMLIASSVLYFLYQAPIQTYLFYHDQTVAFWILLVLSVAPGVDYWTIRKRPREPKPISDWPYLLFRVAFVAMFFGAGLSKLQRAGFGWVDGQTLQYWLVRYHLWFNAEWAWPVAQHLSLCAVASFLVLALELLAPLSLWREKLFNAFVVLTLVFVTVVYAVMKISFFSWFIVSYLAFVPWSRWLSHDESEVVERPSWLPAILVIFGLCQLMPMMAKKHAFPFTDYEIFAEYHTVEKFTPIYHLAVEVDGKRKLLSDTDWYEVHFAMEGDPLRGRGRGEAFVERYLKGLGYSKGVVLRTGVKRLSDGGLELESGVVAELRAQEK